MKLNKLRQQIDKVDARLVNLLNRRTRITSEISKAKKKQGESRYSPDREKQILNRLKHISRGPLQAQALEAIYREIMSSSLAQYKPLVIAYLGPQASFTHQAALKRFGSQVTYVSFNSITEVFNGVQKGDAEYGVVPIENSIEGAITHTLDMFVDSDLKICAQIILEVSHNLLAKCQKSKIKRIYSNPQVFAQCRNWLERNLVRAEKIEVSSTARAAQLVGKEKNSACIASLLAAKIYKLNIITPDIEDSPHNITRFLVISKNEIKPSGSDRTSILFSIKDRVGALHDMLMSFKKYRINLTKIESRPSKKKVWDYYFFIDLIGHYKDLKVQKALKELESKCKFLKVLGSYPV
ncbi:MAG: prephenate dehydratase [Candidatus Omnitrophica bacterium]|nr:prephenate dehydratase [Candidatus Omnitrophota bacterium]MBU1871591.1 prephenate dehydratase [Candidatus Omnitrophota bacterium]